MVGRRAASTVRYTSRKLRAPYRAADGSKPSASSSDRAAATVGSVRSGVTETSWPRES